MTNAQVANRCVYLISEFWRQRGFAPHVRVVHHLEPEHWAIESDMVDGLPR